MGEIAIRQAMARARAADDAGDKAACEQALAAAPNVSFRNCQSAQYDALAAPIPSHLAALLKQLETQEGG